MHAIRAKFKDQSTNVYPPGVFSQEIEFWHPKSVPAKIAHSFTSSSQFVPVHASVHWQTYPADEKTLIHVPPFLHGFVEQLSVLSLSNNRLTRISSWRRRRFNMDEFPSDEPPLLFIRFSNCTKRWNKFRFRGLDSLSDGNCRIRSSSVDKRSAKLEFDTLDTLNPSEWTMFITFMSLMFK